MAKRFLLFFLVISVVYIAAPSHHPKAAILAEADIIDSSYGDIEETDFC